MNLCFSTLACDSWTWQEICLKARQYGYQGVELRFTSGHKDLLSNPEFAPDAIRHARIFAEDAGVKVVCVDTGVLLTHPGQVEQGKRCIELAHKLGSKLVRVFPGKPPAGVEREEAFQRAGEQGHELARIGHGAGVKVIMETHDYCVASHDALEVVLRVDHENFGILWDSHHTYRLAKEPFVKTWGLLGPYCEHIHVKDSTGDGEKYHYALAGEGNIPFKELILFLQKEAYTKWLSVEWERSWIPTLEPPEVTLPAYSKYFRALI